MSEFLTWVEILGKDIYFLTDSDIFTYSTLKKTFFDKFTKPSQILGSEAIIEFFKLNKNLARVHTVNDFWNTKKLPKKLADMVTKFDSYWQFCLQNGLFRSSQLLWAMESIPDSKPELKELKLKFWNQLNRQVIKTWDLATFLEFNFIKISARKVSNEWKEKIAQKIIDQTKDEIRAYNHYYISGRHRDQKTRPPHVELWGLAVIKMIFDETHRFRPIAAEMEANFKKNKLAHNRNKKR